MKSSIKRRTALRLVPRIFEDNETPETTVLEVKDSNERLYSFLVENGYAWHTKKRCWQPIEDPTSQVVVSAKVTRATREKLFRLASKRGSDVSSVVRGILNLYFLPELPGFPNVERERNQVIVAELKKLIEMIENPTE